MDRTQSPTTPTHSIRLIGIIIGIVALISLLLLSGLLYWSNMSWKNTEFIEQQQQIELQLTQLRNMPDSTEYAWMTSLNPKAEGIEGGLLWNPSKQQGVMWFENLPHLKEGELYHLWIHDRNQDVSKPVSAEKFNPNRPHPHNLLVPFKPAEHVESPYKFIVTLEYTDASKTPDNLLRIQP